MSRTLAAVTRAQHARDQAGDKYRASIRAAHEAGHTMPEIARAAGLTKQGVRYLLYPDPRKGKQ